MRKNIADTKSVLMKGRHRKGDNMKKILTLLLLLSVCLSSCRSADESILDPDNPVSITVWHYYNGSQLKAFNTLVEEFNSTEGRDLGIFVESYSQGTVNDLASSVMDAVKKRVGSDEVPNIFAAYSDTAYQLDKLGWVVDISPYLTDKDKELYIDGFLDEGRFNDDDAIKIFPVAKSVEVFMLNKTSWDAFADATGASVEGFATIEALVETAKRYYEWTDSLTPVPNDGKALYGRDAMANYMLIGSMQLGVEMFARENGRAVLNFEEEIAKKLWDNYYIPYINGYFSSSGRFRSDDIKTGNIIAFTGSSSGATFFPDKVFLSDTESFPIEMQAFPCPQFEGATPYAVQQGAGMVVTNQSEEEIYASVQFLKWLTIPENNISFSISSGYMPVTKEANNIDTIRDNFDPDKKIESILAVALETINSNSMYTQSASDGGSDARVLLDKSIQDRAVADRGVVVERLNSGMTQSEAVADFETYEHFLGWYENLLTELKAFFPE